MSGKQIAESCDTNENECRTLNHSPFPSQLRQSDITRDVFISLRKEKSDERVIEINCVIHSAADDAGGLKGSNYDKAKPKPSNAIQCDRLTLIKSIPTSPKISRKHFQRIIFLTSIKFN